MDKFMEYITAKIGMVLLVLMGILVPGVLTLFFYKRDIFMELDILKLLLLSCSISIPTYSLLVISDAIATIIKYKLEKQSKKVDINEFFISSLIFNFTIFLIVFCSMLYKLNYNTRDFVISLFIVCLCFCASNILRSVYLVVKEKIINIIHKLQTLKSNSKNIKNEDNKDKNIIEENYSTDVKNDKERIDTAQTETISILNIEECSVPKKNDDI